MVRIVERKQRQNGAFIEIVQVENGHFLKGLNGEKYTVHCIDHGTRVGEDRILKAREIAANSTLWCRACFERVKERNRPKKPRKKGRKIGGKNRPKESQLSL